MSGRVDQVEGDDDKPALAGPRQYTLLVPIERKTRDGAVLETISEVTLNRLKSPAFRRCLNALDKGKGEFAFELVCASSQLPPSVVNELDAEDMTNMVELATPFFQSGQRT